MKKQIFLSLSFFVLAVTALSSCSKDDKGPGPVSSAVPGAGWKVALFTEPKENKTSDFIGYTLEFGSTGTLTITGNGQAITGTWKQHQDDGVSKLLITLNTTDNHLSKLNDDWVIVSKTETLISLKDDNVVSAEVLQFAK